MASWSDRREREIALTFGRCLLTLGWKTPYFIPADQIVAVLGGPSFEAYVRQDLAYLLDEFNRQLGRTLKPEFLSTALDWSDPNLSLAELVGTVAAQLNET